MCGIVAILREVGVEVLVVVAGGVRVGVLGRVSGGVATSTFRTQRGIMLVDREGKTNYSASGLIWLVLVGMVNVCDLTWHLALNSLIGSRLMNTTTHVYV